MPDKNQFECEPEKSNIGQLIEIMEKLRDPETGCPWDIEQNFASIAPYTIEEAYEVAEAIENDDMVELKDELGDLLLQVVFHARMAEEQNSFDFADVVGAVSDKMIRRHPHVFADTVIESAEAQTAHWEELKSAERDRKSLRQDTGQDNSAMADVIAALPALMRAQKLQKRAARVGFDWPNLAPVFGKIHEEMDEIREVIDQGSDQDRLEDEIGDLLFACVNLARKLDIDAETALRRGNAKFERRFRRVESLLLAEGKSPATSSLDEMEDKWQAAKREELAPE